jgi:outer membrane autotransporter protein
VVDNSRQSVYAARLRAAYTFGQEESHYIRPYLDLDLIYSESSGFNESGAGELALRKGSSSQFNVGISPMVEFGSDFLTEDKTRVKVFVSAGATFLPNNNQTMVTSFVGASAANGTFDVVTNGPDVLGRLNLGVEVFQASGFQVRAQYGLQAGQNYLSQSLSANLVYRF